MFAKLVAFFAIVAVALAKPQYLTTDNTAYTVGAVPLAYNAPVAYQAAAPLAYQAAAPVAYQAAPVAYQATPVAYQAAAPVAYQASPLAYQTALPVSYTYGAAVAV